MKPHEQGQILLRKAKQDEDLLDAILSNTAIADEIFGFHAQQAAEKILKAVLANYGIAFKRIHNLRELMDLLGKNGHVLPGEFSDLDRLTPFGTLARYEEGDSDLKLNRTKTRKTLQELRVWAENKIAARKPG